MEGYNENRPGSHELGGEGKRGGKENDSSENQGNHSANGQCGQYRLLLAQPVHTAELITFCPIRLADEATITTCLGQPCAAFRPVNEKQGYCKLIEDGGRVR